MERSERSAVCESLEVRRMMAVTASLSAGVLEIDGTSGADTITVEPSGGNVCVNWDSDSAYEASFSSGLVTQISISAGWGDDQVNVFNSLTMRAYIDGSAGKDTLGGGGGHDTIWGGDGDDKIDGDDGNDSLWGQSGDDYIEGDAGDDSLHGGTGSDTLRGDSGDDKLWGDGGSDRLEGGSGSDLLYYDSDDYWVDPSSPDY